MSGWSWPRCGGTGCRVASAAPTVNCPVLVEVRLSPASSECAWRDRSKEARVQGMPHIPFAGRMVRPSVSPRIFAFRNTAVERERFRQSTACAIAEYSYVSPRFSFLPLPFVQSTPCVYPPDRVSVKRVFSFRIPRVRVSYG